MPTHKSDPRWLLPLVLALLSLGVSAFSGYARADKDLTQRVTRVEVHVADDRETLQEIKAAQKALDDKINQILVILSQSKH